MQSLELLDYCSSPEPPKRPRQDACESPYDSSQPAKRCKLDSADSEQPSEPTKHQSAKPHEKPLRVTPLHTADEKQQRQQLTGDE